VAAAQIEQKPRRGRTGRGKFNLEGTTRRGSIRHRLHPAQTEGTRQGAALYPRYPGVPGAAGKIGITFTLRLPHCDTLVACASARQRRSWRQLSQQIERAPEMSDCLVMGRPVCATGTGAPPVGLPERTALIRLM
jgi:hypothetical protein